MTGDAVALGVGFTSTVAVIGIPENPLAVGVIVNITVIGILVILVSVPVISPTPLAAIPVTVAALSLVQLNTVPTTLPVNAIVTMATPEHFVWEAGVATTLGVGFTITVAVVAAPELLLAVGIMVKVTGMGAFAVLVKLPPILPDPLLAIPVTLPVLSRSQV